MKKPFCATIIMSLVGILLRGVFAGMMWEILTIGVCILTYFACMILFAREDLNKLLSYVKK